MADSEADLQCSGPRGIATAPASAGPGVAGNVFVADSFNQRIDEFTVWGQFVRAWGWDVVASGPGDSGTGFEICLAEEGDVCKAGVGGGGAGQFGVSSPQGVAVDSAGNVYALDRGTPSNQRVQKFDSEGHFLLTFGKGVNETSGGNICPRPGFPADVCKAGGEGTGPGEFGELSVVGSYIAVDTAGAGAADDKVYVGDQGRIQRFNTNGEYQAEIPLPGERARALAVDPAGNLYVGFCGVSCASGAAAKANVEKLSPAGAKLDTIIVGNPQALATGPSPSGNLYAIDGTTVREFSGTSGDEIVEETNVFPFFPTYPFAPGLSSSTGIATGSACLTSGYDLYVSNAAEPPNGFVRAYGPPPDEAHTALCPPTERPPEIEAQGALVVETDRAVVEATINPKFWADTSYAVQFGTTDCIEAGGWEAPCVTQIPDPEALLGAGAIDGGALRLPSRCQFSRRP